MYTSLPFGLKHSGDKFRRSISTMLDNVELKSNFANYVDVVLAFSADCETHLKVLKQISAACRDYGARLGQRSAHTGKAQPALWGE
jgi:hypothetical protein